MNERTSWWEEQIKLIEEQNAELREWIKELKTTEGDKDE